MSGEYIADRWMVSMLRESCVDKGIAFSSWSDDWLLELQKDGIIHRVVGYRFGLNDSAAASISQDKVATYTLLRHHNVAAVEHVLVRTKVSHADKQTIENLQRIVIKPLVGTGGHGVQLFDDTRVAADFVEKSVIAAWAASPFVEINREIRIIMLDGEPLLSYEKRAVERDGLKMFNLGMGATPQDIEPDNELIELARTACRVLQLRLAAIDIIEDASGVLKILEVNDGIMMENYARVGEGNRTRAVNVYWEILKAMFEK